MSALFWLLGMLAYFYGLLVFAGAKSAIHESVGFLVFLIGTVFFVGAGIIGAIDKVAKNTKVTVPAASGKTPTSDSAPDSGGW